MSPPRRSPAGTSLGVCVLLIASAVTGLVLTVSQPAAGQSSDLVISNANAAPTVPFKNFDGNPTKLYDIDKDGDKEIIAQNDNHWVYVFNSKTGKILFEARATIPPHWGARTFNGPEVAVVNEGGQVRLIIASSAAVVSSFRFDPGASTEHNFHFTKQWDRRLNHCFSDAAMDAKPVLADLDQNGRLEILGATEEHGLYALRLDGSILWKNCLGGGNAAPAVADLNQDGFPDVVHVSDAGVVAALDGRTGGWMWGYPILAHFNLRTGSIPVSAGVGQLDGAGGPDIVVGARDSHDMNNFDNNHALLLALSSNGRVLWANQHPQANPLTYTRPVVVDADHDGRNEVYWGDWNTIGHKPPPPDSKDAWATTGPANFYRYSASGELVWRQTLNTYWSNKDLTIADVTGDGVQNVLANGPGHTGDGVWYLDARNGAKQKFVSVHPWKVSRGPIAGDIWGHGTTQWVAQVQAAAPSVSGGAIFLHNTGVPFDAAWPHLPDPSLGSQPPEPTGAFASTFHIKSPNAWWQELTVAPDTPRTITKAELRINGGAWLSMSRSSWGAWTSSFHTPAGSHVEFRAFDSTGAVSQSLPFTWLDGTLTKRSVDPGEAPPPPTDTTFTPADGVNEWWIDVKVESSARITSVEARVNQGVWTQLSPTSWGTWAKSIHAPTGSTVEFRATAADGQTTTSDPFTWLSDAPTPGGFSATFERSSNVNNWWAEVTVRSTHTISSVSATVESGSPVALSKTDWGTWAKSFHIPSGATVHFKATNAQGDTTTSQAVTWP